MIRSSFIARVAVVVSMSSLVFACGGSDPTPKVAARPDVTGQKDIIPGESVRGVKIGMTRDEVRALLGAPEGTEESGPNDPSPAWYYGSRGFEVSFFEGKVGNIWIYGFEHPKGMPYVGSTPEGLNVASTRADVHAKYGPGEGKGQETYDARGIMFEYRDNGAIKVIQVIKKAAK